MDDRFYLDDLTTARIRSDLDDLHKFLNHTYTLIRIPKTASASLARACFNSLTEVYLENIPEHVCLEPNNFPWWDHYSAIFCRETLGNEIWDVSYNFSLVRNPWARLYSLWKYTHCSTWRTLIVGKEPSSDDKAMADISFEDWIMQGCHHPGLLKPHQKIVFPKDPVISQANWLCDENGIYIVNLIVRLEELDSVGIPIFKKLFGARFQLPPVKLNQTSYQNEYIEYYKPHMIEYVAHKCADDIERFKYKFDGVLEPGWLYLND